MKEAMGGISIFQIVIIFVLLFTGIMCLTINHSRAYGVKDEIVNIIQTNDPSLKALSADTITKVVKQLQESGYRITGKCPDGWTGYDLNGNKSNNASFCIKANNISNTFLEDAKEKCKNNKCKTTNDDFTMYYYDIILFYQLDIPGINELMNFKMYGSTRVLFSKV